MAHKYFLYKEQLLKTVAKFYVLNVSVSSTGPIYTKI